MKTHPTVFRGVFFCFLPAFPQPSTLHQNSNEDRAESYLSHSYRFEGGKSCEIFGGRNVSTRTFQALAARRHRISDQPLGIYNRRHRISDRRLGIDGRRLGIDGRRLGNGGRTLENGDFRLRFYIQFNIQCFIVVDYQILNLNKRLMRNQLFGSRKRSNGRASRCFPVLGISVFCFVCRSAQCGCLIVSMFDAADALFFFADQGGGGARPTRPPVHIPIGFASEIFVGFRTLSARHEKTLRLSDFSEIKNTPPKKNSPTNVRILQKNPPPPTNRFNAHKRTNKEK